MANALKSFSTTNYNLATDRGNSMNAPFYKSRYTTHSFFNNRRLQIISGHETVKENGCCISNSGHLAKFVTVCGHSLLISSGNEVSF